LISDEVANTGSAADADISVKAAMLHLLDPRHSGQLQPERKTFMRLAVIVRLPPSLP
jgi:hypothetical protein